MRQDVPVEHLLQMLGSQHSSQFEGQMRHEAIVGLKYWVELQD
jgi:hypothetical protein